MSKMKEVQNYRLIVSASGLYREVELHQDVLRVLIGTDLGSEVRFRAQSFFEPFGFFVARNEDGWQIECGENVYATADHVRKQMILPLTPGNQISVCYWNSDAEVVAVRLEYDFQQQKHAYDRVLNLSSLQSITISGGNSNAQISLKDPLTVKDHCVIEKSSAYRTLSAADTGIGIRLNGQTVVGKKPLQDMDFIEIGPYSFCLCGDLLYTDRSADLTLNGLSFEDRVESVNQLDYPKFNRSTRIRLNPSEEKIKVLDPPSEPNEPERDIVKQLMPSVAMLGVVVLLRGSSQGSNTSFILMSVGTMGVGILTSIYTIFKDRSNYKKKLVDRSKAYETYITNKRSTIREYREEEARILEETFYSADKELTMVEGFDRSLFDRVPADKDFLEVRLGTGDRESVRKTETKDREKVEATDNLTEIPSKVEEEFKYLSDAPVTLDLKKASIVGITGSRDALHQMLRILTLDLSSRHYFTDLQLFYVLEPEDEEAFTFLRFLPHVQNDALNRRNIICDDESKNIILEYLYKLLSGRSEKEQNPRLVVFLYRDRGIRSHPISDLMHLGKTIGVTFVYFDEYEENLPSDCDYVIRMESSLKGTCLDSHDGTKEQAFTGTEVSQAALLGAARKMAPVYCEEISLEGTLTRNISFFELLGIYDPQDLDLTSAWAANHVYDGMAAPLGVKSKNQIIALDLHEKAHGPHGLVAGTTGSGKSEILQSYILSMALKYHPYEVGFVIIDFKGGGMVNQFRDLPHLVGAITNIDGKEIDRSLLSIRAELNKRQELFARYGVNHIDQYIRLFRKGEAVTPLPHLILIVDEFAELKMDQPEFMKELVSTARIGRSLGVHLILATQKPSGVVDPQIWSNSRFKLCLKVQSKEDSNEVLKNPLAAEIKEPGRAYLQVGNNEIFELFQSAYSGGPARMEGLTAKRKFRICQVSFEGRRTIVYEQKPQKSEEVETTQLQSVVDYVSGSAVRQGIARLPFICLPPLPQNLPYTTDMGHPDIEEGLTACVGMYDDPSRQYQGPMTVNVTTDNTFIIGSSQYGKTNFLQTMLRSLVETYTPDQLHVYILDFGTMIFRNFAKLAHVGGVVCSFEEEKLKNLFKMMNQEIKDRKEALSAAGVSSYASYLEAGLTGMPQIVIMIDNMTAMREMYLNDNDFLLPVCREGLSVGISVVGANLQTSGFGFRYLSNFGNRYAFYCNDNTEYSMLLSSGKLQPSNLPGRCVFEMDKTIYEGQISLAFTGEKEIERVEQIRLLVEELNKKYPESRARRIPVVPEEVTREVLEAEFDAVSTNTDLLLGVDFGTVSPAYLAMTRYGYLAVSGRDEMGRPEFIRYLAEETVRLQGKLYVLDDEINSLSYMEEMSCCGLYTREPEYLHDLLAEVKMIAEERFREAGTLGAEMIVKEPPVLLLLQSPDAAAQISKDADLLSVYKDLTGKYQNLGICIVFTNVENTAIAYASPDVLKAMRDTRRFLIFENLQAIKLTDFAIAIQRKFNKPLSPGDAYLVEENNVYRIRTITG